MNDERPKVGVGVIVIKDGRVLIGFRKSGHGANTWQFPGGHLELGENLFDCAAREVVEETGVQITNQRRVAFSENIFEKEKKHYVTLYVQADWQLGEPQALEPEKAEQWQWVAWNNLPRPLFPAIESLLEQGYRP